MSLTVSSDKTSLKNFLMQNKTVLIIAAKVFIALGLLYYLISSVEYDQVISAIENANLYLAGTACALSFLNIYLQYSKWRLTCDHLLLETKRSKILTSLFYGFSAGTITPLRVGEYFGRAIVFKDKSLLQVTVATLIDKFFPLLMVAFLGSVSSIMFIHFYFNVSIYLTLSLFVVVFTLFYFLVLLILNKKFWDNILFAKLRTSKRLNRLFEKLEIFKNLDREYLFKMIFVSLLFYLCFLVQYALLVAAFSHHYNFTSYLWAGNLIMFAKTVIPPISLGELGIREGASVYFLSQMGETATAAFNASIFLFIINLLIPALIGLGLMLRKNGN